MFKTFHSIHKVSKVFLMMWLLLVLAQLANTQQRPEHSTAADAPMSTDANTHGLGLVDGFDMGNGAGVYEPDNTRGGYDLSRANFSEGTVAEAVNQSAYYHAA